MINEFVMVPRELDVEGAKDFYNEHWTGRCEDLWPQLMDYVKAKPVEQHQGEPVALPQHNRVVVDSPITSDPQGFVDGWNACVARLAELGPLYTHADPAEVRVTKQAPESLKGEANDLRAKLAERDGLLRDFCAHSALICGDLLRLAREDDLATTDPIRTRAYSAMDHARKVKKTLSASTEPSAPKCRACNDSGPELIKGVYLTCRACAEPSAPVEIDERAAFETWYIRDVGPGLANLSRINTGSRAYEDEDAMSAWEGWQARAALERKQ